MDSYTTINPQVSNEEGKGKLFGLVGKVNIKGRKIAAVGVGIVLSILLLVFGFKIVQDFFAGASYIAPRDVVITDIKEDSAVIEWSTAVETQGVVEYGTTPNSLNFFSPETQKTTKHKVELTLLSPGTTYYFQIRIGDKVFDNAGVPWSFTTRVKEGQKKQTGAQPTPVPKTSPPKTPTPKKKPTPTPYQTLKLDSKKKEQDTNEQVCKSNDCNKIKENFGKGCTTEDYIKCLLRLTATPTP